jgi:hypothetical protein
LVQHRFSGDLAYVGAIVICGTKAEYKAHSIRHQSHWRKLSLLKALVTPLLESARWLKGVPTLRNKEIPHDLLFEVLLSDLRKDNNLFQGKCPERSGCSIHDKNPGLTRERHDYDCRLERQNRLFAKKAIFGLKNAALAKSLFSFGNLVHEGGGAGRLVIQDAATIKDTRPQDSHCCSVSAIAEFFRAAFGISISTAGDAKTLVLWPFKPGLISCLLPRRIAKPQYTLLFLLFKVSCRNFASG